MFGWWVFLEPGKARPFPAVKPSMVALPAGVRSEPLPLTGPTSAGLSPSRQARYFSTANPLQPADHGLRALALPFRCVSAFPLYRLIQLAQVLTARELGVWNINLCCFELYITFAAFTVPTTCSVTPRPCIMDDRFGSTAKRTFHPEGYELSIAHAANLALSGIGAQKLVRHASTSSSAFTTLT